MLNDAVAINKLLCHEACGGDHSEAAVIELLGLHLEELLLSGRLEAEGVEVEVTGSVVITEQARLVDRNLGGISPASLGTELLGGANADDQHGPESSGDLGDVGDSRASDLGIEQEGGPLDLLADEEADRGEHSDAAMGELGLAVPAHGHVIGLLSEAEGIEENILGETAGKLCDVNSVERGGGLAGLSRGEGSGRGDEKGGGDELHNLLLLFVLRGVMRFAICEL